MAVIVLQAAGALLGSNWLWGVQMLRFWDPGPAVAIALLGVAGFVPAIARALGSAIERLGALLDRGHWLTDLLIAAAAGVALFLLRDPLRFTGDSSMRVQTIGYVRPPTTLFPQAAMLDLWVNFHLPRWLLSQGWDAASALQAVGAMVGSAFTISVLRTLRALGATGAAYFAGAVVALGGAHLTHFAGYDKFGPVMLGISIAALGAVRLSRGRGGAWVLGLGAALCALGHRSGLLVLPAAAWVFAQAWRTESDPARRARILAATLIPALALGFVLPWAFKIFSTIDLQVHLPGGAVEKNLESPDAPALLVRSSDLLNALLLLAPLWPAGLALGLAPRPPEVGSRAARFGLAPAVALAIGIQAAVLIVVGATRGSGRDWDAAAPAGALAAIAGAGALAVRWRSSPAGTVPAITTALAISIAIWGVHVDESRAMRRVESLLAAHPSWSSSARAHAYDFIGLRAFSLGRYAESAAAFQRAAESAANPRYFHQLGMTYLYAGRPDLAREPLRTATRRDPRMVDPWIGLARADAALGDTRSALAALDSAAARPGGAARVAALRRSLTPARE